MTSMLWDLETGTKISTIAEVDGDMMAVDISPHDRNIICTSSCDRSVRIFDLRISSTSRKSGTFLAHSPFLTRSRSNTTQTQKRRELNSYTRRMPTL